MSARPIVLAVTLLLVAASAHPQQVWEPDRPDAHAPLGIPHGHILVPGQLTFGYRYHHGRFEGLRSGTDRMEPEAVFELGYARAPRSLATHDHVIEVLYAAAERMTVVAELPLVQRRMAIEHRFGQDPDMRASGLGDIRVGALYSILEDPTRRLHGALLLSLPTGATDVRDPAGTTPYALQAGSGTFDITPALTWVDQRPSWSWGSQASGTLRVGDGPEGWALGNRVDASVWAARILAPWASGSFRLAGAAWGDVRDRVDQFPHSPAAEPGLTGGNRIDAHLGLNLRGLAGALAGHKLFAEVGLPLYQSLDGPQLGLRWRGSLGWRWSTP